MNRRKLLTTAAASVALPGAVKAESISVTEMSSPAKGMATTTMPLSPDAELIAACNEHLRLQRAIETYRDALPDDADADDIERGMLLAKASLVDTIVAAHATTAEGFLARDRCTTFHWLPQARVCRDNPADAYEDRFRAASVRDLVAMERGNGLAPMAARGAAPSSPDAALLEACAAFDALERAYDATFVRGQGSGPEWDAAELERVRLGDEQEAWVDRMCELRAITQEGMIARARSLTLWDKNLMKPGRDTGACLAQAIVRDLLAGEGGA